MVDGVSSEWARVSMGVPQGSILGLLLFLIFMNDLPDVVENAPLTFMLMTPQFIQLMLQWSENECGKDTVNGSQ